MLQTFKNAIRGGYRLIMSLGLLLGIVSSCNALRDNTIAVRNDDGGGEAVALRVRAGVRDIATKAETQTSAEKQVNTLDLFIFDTDSEALLFKQRVSAASAEVRITKGTRTFYALVNAPAAASALSTLSEVAAYHAAFADQGRSSFFMAGSKAVTVTSATTEVVVDVRRDVARVDLVNAPTFSGQAAGATFNAAYLINVPKTYSASATVAAAADAWNFGDAVKTASEQDALLKLATAGTVYGMPNTTAEAAAIDGTDYVTKLVIKATVNGSVYWYPIGIPGIASNKRYVVENVYIKGVGSDTPNAYVDNKVLSATVNVVDWDDDTIDGSYHGDLLTDPTALAFEIVTGGDIVWKCNDARIAKTISYSKNNGNTWTEITSTTEGAVIPVNAGDRVLIKGNNSAYGSDTGQHNFFGNGGASYNISGDIMNLLDENSRALSKVQDYALYGLFCDNYACLSIENLILPATTLGDSCYADMFSNCQNISTAPALPATTLTGGCYSAMFYGCTNLKSAPELPATTLEGSCYAYMFSGCTDLTVAPELPATTLAYDCYQYMFSGCTGLTVAPELPATAMAGECYRGMFLDCTSLTTAPTLPAISLDENCYQDMFNGCENLSYVKAMFITDTPIDYMPLWLDGVAPTGTFVKNSAATWDRNDADIPSGWTVETVTP